MGLVRRGTGGVWDSWGMGLVGHGMGGTDRKDCLGIDLN